jgi:integrase/recombinase XerD
MSKYVQGFENYLRTERGLSENTVYNYMLDIKQFVEFMDKPLNRVSSQDITRYILHLNECGIGTSSRNRKLSTLKTFYRFMVRKAYMKSNPAADIEGAKTEKKLPKPIDLEDINRMIEQVDNLRDRTLLEVLYATGMRREEVVTIKVADINFNHSFLRVMGKGGKERYVPIHDEALDLIRKLMSSQDSEWLFVGEDGHLSKRQVNEIIAKWRDKAGLGWVTPHKFRHSFATHMFQRGMDIKVLQDLLGHASPNTTQVYTRVSNERNKAEYMQYHPKAKARA